jgi:predicted phosphodiesterase
MYPMQFDELHSVSDLHLGGETGRQIFAGTDELAALIDSLTGAPAERRIAFVVNGDFTDFLAEPDAQAFDPDGATRKLARIQSDPSFKPVFAALRRFVAKPRRLLAIVVGNHDIELVLPDVREALVESLAGGDDAARGRIALCLDGVGFLADVGGRSVLCIHGNDVDTWNATDYEHLRRLAQDRQAGLSVEPWTPNAGSKMVIEVMNGIKRSLPFVDLLKPETNAVVPILMALDQGTVARLRGAASVAARLIHDTVWRKVGLLSEEEEAPTGASAAVTVDPLADLLRDHLSRTTSAPAPQSVELLRRTEDLFRRGTDPLTLLGGNADQQLGFGDAVLDWIRGRSKVEILREALEPVQTDKSFDPLAEDDTFRNVCARASSRHAFVVTGHTHLERTLQREGGGRYFNTGTWARLIRIPKAKLETEAAFKPVFEALQLSTIEKLDEVDGLVERRPAVASVWTEGSSVRGALRRVALVGGKLELTPVGKGD